MSPTVLGALLGGTGVAMGAIGAHPIKDRVSAEALGWWQTGVLYQLVHALLLIAAGSLLSAHARGGLITASVGFGVLIFSGTLYAMTLGGPRWLGAVTPLGGTLLIAGWLGLAWIARSR